MTNPIANNPPATDQSDTVPVLRPPTVNPATSTNATDASTNAAVDLIRSKLAAIYAEEPDAKAEIEIAEVKQQAASRSKHQQFMHELNASGKSLAQVQTEWHHYYSGLSDEAKREVWQEFYNNSAQQRQSAYHQQPAPSSPVVTPAAARTNPLYPSYSAHPGVVAADNTPSHDPKPLPAPDEQRPASVIRQQLRETVSSRGKLKVKHHLQSLVFGLGFGALVLLVVLFSFFNEVVVAPFIQPSRTVSARPIIVNSDGITQSDKSEVIIPKINLEIPLDFSAKTIDEKEIEKGLDNGVAHYPTTALPGQQGNAAFFGHSSNNIFNPGKYKFAFVLLHELVPGDTFYLTHKGVSYSYVVYDKKIVEPTDVSVLNPVEGKAATAVLVTCDPPGTSLRRLVVWGQQTSPNPNSNTAIEPTATTSGAEQALPGNGPTLWRRLLNNFN